MSRPDSMTLYGARGSGSASAELGLELAGVPYRLVEAATWLPKSARSELEQVNPLKQIPTLVLPDGTVLTESAAILIHLGLAYPASGLLPKEGSARAQAIRGLVYIAANCYVAISIIDYPQRWCTRADADTKERMRSGTRKRLHHHWNIFADQFGDSPGFGGRQPGALDVLAMVVSQWSGARKHLAKARPAFHEKLLRIEAHPSVAPVLARHRDT